MSEEEINIAIAEYRGWQILEPEVHRVITYHWVIEPDGSKSILPDCCNDLNEMHEVERLLDDDQWLEYMLNLQDVLQRDPNRGKWIVCQDNMHSTAAQRAKAFVKTIGKWKE